MQFRYRCYWPVDVRDPCVCVVFLLSADRLSYASRCIASTVSSLMWVMDCAKSCACAGVFLVCTRFLRWVGAQICVFTRMCMGMDVYKRGVCLEPCMGPRVLAWSESQKCPDNRHRTMAKYKSADAYSAVTTHNRRAWLHYAKQPTRSSWEMLYRDELPSAFFMGDSSAVRLNSCAVTALFAGVPL